jgi:opacity protein-like surface antigen
MKKYPLLLLLLAPLAIYSQQPTMQPTPETKKKPAEHHSIGIGIKAGFNFANVTNASAINGSSRAGYHFGLFLAPSSKGFLGSRTELVYSRHGYNYKTDTVNGAVNLDYIMLTQMMAFHITRYFDLHLGGYSAYLLSAKSDTTAKALAGTPYASYASMLSFYNRFDYGFGVGAEIHPVAGLIIGVRYQLSFANLYKTPTIDSTGSAPPPSVAPNFNLKNNVVMISIGYRF